MSLNTAARAASTPMPPLSFAAETARPAEAGANDFAGLLVERRAARAADGARPGQRNAFDVPAPAAATAPRPPAATEPPARDRAAAAEASPRSDSAGAAKPAAPSRQAERAETRPRSTEAVAPRRDAAAADAASAVATTLPGDGEQATTDPLDGIRAQAVIDWFARLETPAPVAPTAIPALPQGDAAAAAPTLPGTPGALALTTPAEASARAALDTATLQGETPATAGAPIAAVLEPAPGEASFADVAAQTVPAEAAVARLEPGSPTPLTPPLPTALSGASAVPRAGATTTLALATPVTAPDFSQALATQLTTLARDGVQHATLQLNPAEMGPIAVKIVLDGAQAQIDFAAEHARTREAIEAGLPTLAAALHGAGLTLAGGGVFEQRRGQGDTPGAAPGPSAGDGESAGEPVAGVTPQRHVVRGLVDTYA